MDSSSWMDRKDVPFCITRCLWGESLKPLCTCRNWGSTVHSWFIKSPILASSDWGLYFHDSASSLEFHSGKPTFHWLQVTMAAPDSLLCQAGCAFRSFWGEESWRPAHLYLCSFIYSDLSGTWACHGSCLWKRVLLAKINQKTALNYIHSWA